MKIYISNLKILMVSLILLMACEAEDYPGTELKVSFPEIVLDGPEFFSTVMGGSTFDEPGFTATFGVTEITDQVAIDTDLDLSTPGVYSVNYSVSIENEIGEQSNTTVTRFVAVTSEDISGVDLSGDYQGSGFGSDIVPISTLAPGWYNCPKALASGNNVNVNFAHLGGDMIVMPDQVTGFGVASTTRPGTSASLTPTGFQWTFFLGANGIFGPIVFTKL